MESTIRAMSGRIAHRGPDSHGYWIDTAAGLALGHRRLSIVDLSSAGHQPMPSADGRFIISFNGEIYNHVAIREELAGHGVTEWRGHSDTETLVAAIALWGMQGALERINGMFAFLVWDRALRELHLARDRMGEKPLYYGRVGSSVLFGSELRSFREHPDWVGEVDRGALTTFLRHGHVPSPYSIFRGIRKLPPGHYLTLTDRPASDPEPICYWSLSGAVSRGHRERFEGSDAEAVRTLDERLQKAVGLNMMSDVPLGAFLSGGCDSATVVALMQAQTSQPVRTFTIGFHADGYDEAQHARVIARHLGTDHTEAYLQPQDIMDVVPTIAGLWDEPFGDASQIPTYLLSRLARKSVTVSLSGDGGDELFCGYNRYLQGYNLWSRLHRLPGPARAALAEVLRRIPAASADRIAGLLPSRIRIPAAGASLHKLADTLSSHDAETFYRTVLSHAKRPAELVVGGGELPTLLNDPSDWPAVGDTRELMMYLDTATYLPDDILTKLDRASMAVALEARVPLLNHELVEFAQTIPLSLKIRNGQSKWLLRQVLYRHVPEELMNRPKMGFRPPVEGWLQGPLRAWGEALLAPDRLRAEGYLDPVAVRRMWDEFQAGARRWHAPLWNIVMFQSWLELQAQETGTAA